MKFAETPIQKIPKFDRRSNEDIEIVGFHEVNTAYKLLDKIKDLNGRYWLSAEALNRFIDVCRDRFDY